MVALSRRKRLNFPLAPVIAAAVAALAALVFALLPADLLGQIVLDSGIAALVPAAEPPLGGTARAALILIFGGGLGLVAWFTMFLLVGARTISFSGKAGDGVPVLRRADAHPDAPARRPVFANQDLGTPFLEVRARPIHAVAEPALDPFIESTPESTPAAIEDAVFEPAPPIDQEPLEQDLPADLDQPLSAYDPSAIPEEPLDWFPPSAQVIIASSRPPVFDASERFETFELTPITRPAPEPVTESAPGTVAELSVFEPVVVPAPRRAVDYDSSASIHALLDRLERGVTRREAVAAPPAPPPPPAPREESLQDALVSLRRLATRAG
ncbi:hypothetical protein ACVWZA_001920 [Sphingomonas sp. UYAg733]